MPPSSLFAYGTLQHPSVLAFVLERPALQGEPALLQDHVRFRIQDADYPGIYPQKGAEVDGTLFPSLTPEDWIRLDTYESELYERRHVCVLLKDGSLTEAFAYVLPPEHESVCTGEPWHLNQYQPPRLPE